MMKQCVRKRIGDGLDTGVWRVPWLPDVNNGYLTTEAPEQLQHIMVNGLLEESQRRWDVGVISDLFDEWDQQLIM